MMNRAIKRSLGASIRGQFDMLKFRYNLGRVSCFWPTQIKKCEKETEKKKSPLSIRVVCHPQTTGRK